MSAPNTVDFAQWLWGLLIVPIITLFTVKADKSDITGVQNDLKHITERVDKIYEYLIDKTCEKKDEN